MEMREFLLGFRRRCLSLRFFFFVLVNFNFDVRSVKLFVVESSSSKLLSLKLHVAGVGFMAQIACLLACC